MHKFESSGEHNDNFNPNSCLLEVLEYKGCQFKCRDLTHFVQVFYGLSFTI